VSDAENEDSAEINELLRTVRAEMDTLESAGKRPWAAMSSERILQLCVPALRARGQVEDGRAVHLRDEEARCIVYRGLRHDLGRITGSDPPRGSSHLALRGRRPPRQDT
jgi:hypothetical protein